MQRSLQRSLLQGEGAESTLPNLFGQESCSAYGSHGSEWLRSAPRWRIGLAPFGDVAEEGEFWPWSSVYLEPIIALSMVGMLLWTLLGLAACAFFILRYYYGLAGEPFPTTKKYPRHEVARAMTTTVVCFLLLGALGFFALLVTRSAPPPHHLAFASLLTPRLAFAAAPLPTAHSTRRSCRRSASRRCCTTRSPSAAR